MRVLLVEDDDAIAQMLCEFFAQHAVDAVHAPDAATASHFSMTESFDAAVVDIDLPDGDGIELCGVIGAAQRCAVIMSTAYGDIDTKLSAFGGGARDYLVKPYDPRELLARLQTLSGLDGKVPKCVGGFKDDAAQKCIYQHDRRIDLTTTEYEILSLLLRRKGQVVSRMDIATDIEGHRFESDIQSINVLISRLRKKIGTEHIVTLRNLGYKFVP